MIATRLTVLLTSLLSISLLAGCSQHRHDHHDHHHDHDHDHMHSSSSDQEIVVEPKTAHLPERVVLAPGVTVIPDVTDHDRIPGVDTLEGRFGPLLLNDNSTVYFMEMVPGFYIHDHPHRSRTVIYTATGNWVLCSEGNRTVMEQGSLFVFEPNRPTGYEVPFEEKAMILIFEVTDEPADPAEFMEGLRGLRDRLKERHDNGMPFFLHELEPDHPAREFARQVNPAFARKLDTEQ